MSERYESSHTGPAIDGAIQDVKDNNCKIKWGNILRGEEDPAINSQTDLWNAFVKRQEEDTITGNLVVSQQEPHFYISLTDVSRKTGDTNPNTTKEGGFVGLDKYALGSSGKKIGAFLTGRTDSGVFFSNISVYNNANNSSNSIGINWDTTNGYYTSAPTPPTGDNSTKIATTAWVNSASGVVHTSGTENISGAKTFTGTVSFSGTSTAISPPAGDNSIRIATTAWVNSASGVVHTSGAENISGIKTFTADPRILNSQPTLDVMMSGVNKGTAPSSATYGGVHIYDQNGTDTLNRMGGFATYSISTGDNSSRMYVYKPQANDSSYEYMGISCAQNGTFYTYAPTPSSANESSNQIATTAWVKSCLANGTNNVLNGNTTTLVTNLGTYTSGTATAALSGSNSIFAIYLNGASKLNISLPTISSTNRYKLHQILLYLQIRTTAPTVSWGTSYFFHKVAPTVTSSCNLTIIYEYDSLMGQWVCGSLLKGS